MFENIVIHVIATQHHQKTLQTILEHVFSDSQNITTHFFSDAFEGAKAVLDFEPDILLIEEELFDFYKNGFNTLKQPTTVMTNKRTVIFSLVNEIKEKRRLDLSLLGVREVVFGQEGLTKTLQVFCQQIKEFLHTHPKISLCISGGGIDGYLYSLGVCLGLEHSLENFSLNQLDIYSGISSGSIVAASLAAGIPCSDLFKQVHKKHEILEPISFQTLFDFATGEVLKRMMGFARSFAKLNIEESVKALQNMIPLGCFNGLKLKEFMQKQIEYFGLEDHFKSIKKDLFIYVTDQDSGETVTLGKSPWDNIKVSQAMRASTALPPYYLPEKINGHWFTDGQLTTSTNFDEVIHHGASFVILIDPMVPYTSTQAGAINQRGGYFSVLQAIKSLVNSRAIIALQAARDKHPDVDFLLFSPTHQLMESMAGNPMKIPLKLELIDLAYRYTINRMIQYHEVFKHKFAKHGLVLKTKNLLLASEL